MALSPPRDPADHATTYLPQDHGFGGKVEGTIDRSWLDRAPGITAVISDPLTRPDTGNAAVPGAVEA